MKQRVVVTGIGAVTAVGNGIEILWEAATNGISGVSSLNGEFGQDLPTQIAARADQFDARDFMDRKIARRLDRSAQFALASGRMAVEDSGIINGNNFDSDDCGVIDGSALGSLSNVLDQHLGLVNGVRRQAGPMMLIGGMAGNSSAAIAQEFKLRGRAITVAHGSVSSACAIGLGLRTIQEGELSIVVAGGTEAPIHPHILGPFSRAGVLSRQNSRPAEACRPFAIDRDGFVLGEGAAYLVLEELNHAIKRDAHIYCELSGYAENNDASHPTSPDPEAVMLSRAILSSVAEAGLELEDIGYINLHGTGTTHNDLVECRAMSNVFGCVESQPPVGSTKPIVGHLIGASGGLEAALVVMAIEKETLPPSINCNPLDPECEINCSEKTVYDVPLESALSVNISFGGRNTCLAFNKLRVH